MLLGRGAGLKGTSFTDFVASSDAERAAELLLSTSENGCTARAFHTHLVDSCSSKFRTEVFQVKYWMANGKQCHLLGLRELLEAELEGVLTLSLKESVKVLMKVLHFGISLVLNLLDMQGARKRVT